MLVIPGSQMHGNGNEDYHISNRAKFKISNTEQFLKVNKIPAAELIQFFDQSFLGIRSEWAFKIYKK